MNLTAILKSIRIALKIGKSGCTVPVASRHTRSPAVLEPLSWALEAILHCHQQCPANMGVSLFFFFFLLFFSSDPDFTTTL